MLVDRVLHELESYGKALREEDRIILALLLKQPLKKVGAISYASSLHVWAFCLLTILVEQQKQIDYLTHVVNGCVPDRKQDSALDKN